MAAQVFARSVDRIIHEIVRSQHGVVSRVQLLARGVSRHEIQRRLDTSLLIELHRGVYLVGAVPSEHAYAQAALLALRGGVLSHFSAASVWRLRAYPLTASPWVTLPANRRTGKARINVRYTDLAVTDLRRRHGLPLTSPPRTVLDCGCLLDDTYEIESIIAEARFRGLADESELANQVARNSGKRGIAAIRHVLDLPGGPQRTRSHGERAFLRLLREEMIEGFETNSKAFGPELDFVWRELAFAVEVDGWDGHKGRVAFERDRLKIAELQARGVEVMPVTGRQIRDDCGGVVSRLRAALARRRALLLIDGRVLPC